jgi:hypothetical protein
VGYTAIEQRFGIKDAQKTNEIRQVVVTSPGTVVHGSILWLVFRICSLGLVLALVLGRRQLCRLWAEHLLGCQLMPIWFLN